jgi:hypothetical protein
VFIKTDFVGYGAMVSEEPVAYIFRADGTCQNIANLLLSMEVFMFFRIREYYSGDSEEYYVTTR